MKNFFISLVSSDPTSISSTRFAFLLSVLLSNFIIFGSWLGLSIYFGKLLEIPESVIILYGIEEAIVTDTSISKTIINTYHLERKQIFLSLGHVHELRNRKDIIDAMPEILKTFPDFILLIVGGYRNKKTTIISTKTWC